MSETRKLAAILVADVVGYSRLAGADEERTLARLRALRSDLIDPTIAAPPRPHRQAHRRRLDHRVPQRGRRGALRDRGAERHGRAQRWLAARQRRIEFRIGIHLGDVVEESDGDLMGDGVNIAARLEGIAEPGGICPVRGRLSAGAGPGRRRRSSISARQTLKNIARADTGLCAEVERSRRLPERERTAPEKREPPRLSIVVLPFANIGGDPEQDYFVDGVTESLTTDLSRISGAFVIAPQHRLHLQRQGRRREADRPRTQRSLCARRQRAARAETACGSTCS